MSHVRRDQQATGSWRSRLEGAVRDLKAKGFVSSTTTCRVPSKRYIHGPEDQGGWFRSGRPPRCQRIAAGSKHLGVHVHPYMDIFCRYREAPEALNRRIAQGGKIWAGRRSNTEFVGDDSSTDWGPFASPSGSSPTRGFSLDRQARAIGSVTPRHKDPRRQDAGEVPMPFDVKRFSTAVSGPRRRLA